MTYRIGDTSPLDRRWAITGAKLPRPSWYALTTAPAGEARAKQRLEQADIEVCYPTEERTRHRHGKPVTTDAPCIPRLIYAKFRYAPLWHIIRARRIVAGVFTIGGIPIELDPDEIRAAMNMPTVAEALAAEVAEALRIRKGDKAQLVAGPFSSFFVEIKEVAFGVARWEMGAVKGSAALTDLKRCG